MPVGNLSTDVGTLIGIATNCVAPDFDIIDTRDSKNSLINFTVLLSNFKTNATTTQSLVNLNLIQNMLDCGTHFGAVGSMSQQYGERRVTLGLEQGTILPSSQMQTILTRWWNQGDGTGALAGTLNIARGTTATPVDSNMVTTGYNIFNDFNNTNPDWTLATNSRYLLELARAYYMLNGFSGLSTQKTNMLNLGTGGFRSGANTFIPTANGMVAGSTWDVNGAFGLALTYRLLGLMSNNSNFYSLGKQYYDLAITGQNADGSFREASGKDTGYQTVSLEWLGHLYLYGQLDRTSVSNVLSKGWNWMYPRIDGTGRISDDGNTRTNNGGTAGLKPIKYHEAAFALAYWSAISGDTGLLTKAKTMSDYSNTLGF